MLVPRVAEREVEADHLGDGWLLRLNDTGPGFRVVLAPEEDPDPARWEELLAHRDEVKETLINLLENARNADATGRGV
jgi:protease II